MVEIDWSKIKFISRQDEWFVEGSECKYECDYGQPKETDKVENNCGIFHGMTNETFNGYTGELPREDEEGCPFEEFDIYLGDEKINDWTYKELKERLKNICI